MPSWLDHAACRGLDPALFHPLAGDDGREAKLICTTCPVRAACLRDALTYPPSAILGIVGGLSFGERQRLRVADGAQPGRPAGSPPRPSSPRSARTPDGLARVATRTRLHPFAHSRKAPGW